MRCKHCQADLSKPVDADFKGAQPAAPAKPMDDFEVRFLEFAYQSTATLNVPSVAHALRLPTAEVSDKLEDMAARDVIGREVDDEGNVFFTIPGRAKERSRGEPAAGARGGAGRMVHISPPTDGTAVTALVLNIIMPGRRLARGAAHLAGRGAARPVAGELPAVPGPDWISADARRLDLVAGDWNPHFGRVQTQPNCLLNRALAIL